MAEQSSRTVYPSHFKHRLWLAVVTSTDMRTCGAAPLREGPLLGRVCVRVCVWNILLSELQPDLPSDTATANIFIL